MLQVSLDVSELPAPEPFDKIMQAIQNLGKDQYLIVSHRKQPLLLYKPLQESGFSYHVQKGKIQAFDIFIWFKEQNPPAGLVMPSIADTSNPAEKCSDC